MAMTDTDWFPAHEDGIAVRLGGCDDAFVVLWDNGDTTVHSIRSLCERLLQDLVGDEDDPPPPRILGAYERTGNAYDVLSKADVTITPQGLSTLVQVLAGGHILAAGTYPTPTTD